MAPTSKKRGATGKQVAGQIRSDAHQHRHTCADDGITMFAFAEHTANRVIQKPEHDEKGQCHNNRCAGLPIHQCLVDQIGAGIPQIRHSQECKTSDPGAVAFPIKPMQVGGHHRRLAGKFNGVIKTAAVHRPQLAADALLFQVFINGGGQAGV